MTVYPADPGVESLQALLLDVPLLLPACIVQVVGVNDAHYMVKLVRPALTMMVPVEVLWLLKNSYISLQHPPMRWDSSLDQSLALRSHSWLSRLFSTWNFTTCRWTCYPSCASTCVLHIQGARPTSRELKAAIGNTT